MVKPLDELIISDRVILRTAPLTAQSAKMLRKLVFTVWILPPVLGAGDTNSWFYVAVANKKSVLVDGPTAKGQDDSLWKPHPDLPDIRTYRLILHKSIHELSTWTATTQRGDEIVDDLTVGDQILLVARATENGDTMDNTEDATIQAWEEDDLDE